MTSRSILGRCFSMVWRLGLPLVFVLLLGGCARQEELRFVTREKVLALPQQQQDQIGSLLRRHFGTPTNPTLRMVSEKDLDEETPLEEATLEDEEAPQRLRRAAAHYNRRCSGCHGVTGDGNGEAAPFLWPKPRDYRLGTFKFTSTPYDYKPTRGDLMRTIRRGAKGTSMPAFAHLPAEQVGLLADYVILLSKRGEVEYRLQTLADRDYGEDEKLEDADLVDALEYVKRAWERAAQAQRVMPVTPEPPRTEESIAIGRKTFISGECVQCHGRDYRGQLQWLDPEYVAALPLDEQKRLNKDVWGNLAPAADITAGMLHGGRRPIDIYRRIYSGINGTVMPGSGGKFAHDPDMIWHLVHFVLSVVEGKAKPVSDAEMKAAQAAAAPGSPDAGQPEAGEPGAADDSTPAAADTDQAGE